MCDMRMQTGKRAVARREFYAGRPRRRSKQEIDPRKKGLMIRTALSLFFVLLTVLMKLLFPSGAESLHGVLTGGLDYKAAFSALGRAITSGENLVEVFRGIALGGFNTEIGDAETVVPKQSALSATPTPDSTLTDPDQTVEAVSVVGENESGEEGGAGGAEGEYFEELLLRLPSEELEEVPETNKSTPKNVSYEYYVLEFETTDPVKGTITSSFGYRKHPISGKRSFHYGVDIAAAKGTNIVAFASGTVELTGYNATYGNYLFIRHKDGIQTFYGHCSKVLVENGQLVRMGEVVAKMGSTGYSTGSHLHFELRNGELILDPIDFISPESA